ncbi:MAG: FprA family A-type flavoprotein [Clostridiales bacterium]
MNVTSVTNEIFQLSINIDNILFEGLWEIPNGVTLNSYIVKGEKTAIIDGVCGWDGVPESLFELLNKINVDPNSIDYAVINHMEPDHSGWIEDLIKINPNFSIICSKPASDLLKSFYNYTNNIICVKDGDTIDLGNNKILSFYEIPNVHWPDTIATFDKHSGTLFSCDAFGSFGRVKDNLYDNMLSSEQIDFYEKEAVRYYSNIVASFSIPVKKSIEKCRALPIKIVAPGHGIVWRENPQKIINDYERYYSYQKGPAKKEITLIWGSMYGMTEKTITPILNILKEENVKVHVHRVPEDNISNILTSAWTSTGIIIAAPTYEYKMFPPAISTIDELGRKKLFNRKALYLGSYGWSGGAIRDMDETISRNRMNWEFVDKFEFKGYPSENDFNHIAGKVKELAELVKSIGKD